MIFSRQRSWRDLAVLGSAIGLAVASTSALSDDETASAVAPTQAAEPPALALGNAAPISDEVLGTETAKAQIEIDKLVVNDQDLNGVVQGNAAINTQSGNNNVSGDAFQDTAGFVTVIQNTGNNVLIQNSTIVNIALEP
jgi:hypothetical protein